jgi:hypothetical protein
MNKRCKKCSGKGIIPSKKITEIKLQAYVPGKGLSNSYLQRTRFVRRCPICLGTRKEKDWLEAIFGIQRNSVPVISSLSDKFLVEEMKKDRTAYAILHLQSQNIFRIFYENKQ